MMTQSEFVGSSPARIIFIHNNYLVGFPKSFSNSCWIDFMFYRLISSLYFYICFEGINVPDDNYTKSVLNSCLEKFPEV